jgi:DNA-binding transcriptional ArsR family regulator
MDYRARWPLVLPQQVRHLPDQYRMDYRARPRLAARMALNDRQLDRAFRALSNATRRWIVEVLLDGDASVLQLAEPLPLRLPSLMQHLRVLEQCGLIRTRKVGRRRICSVEPDALSAAERWMRSAMWARYRMRLGSLPQDYPRLRDTLRTGG